MPFPEVETCAEMLFSGWLGIFHGLEVCDDSETSYPWCWQNAPALHFTLEILRRKVKHSVRISIVLLLYLASTNTNPHQVE